MEDAELQVLQTAYRASARLLKGYRVTPLEELCLHAVVKMLEPALSPVEKTRNREMLLEISKLRTPTACRLGGRFFR